MRCAVVIASFLLAAPCLAGAQKAKKPVVWQAPPSIVGTWIPDAKVKDPALTGGGTWFRFKADRTFAFQANGFNGAGTYKMKGLVGSFTVTMRNGKMVMAGSRSTADLQLGRDGSHLLLMGDSGPAQALKLVRKKS